MIKNYFKIAWRNLVKHKIDSSISIGGLAVGIACCLLLIAFVHFEWSFDRFHENSNRVFLLYSDYENPNTGKISSSSTTPHPLTTALESNVPELVEAVRFSGYTAEVNINGQYILERNIGRAEPGFFRLFTFPFISGNPVTALDNPNSIVLTREKAEHIFGTFRVVGEELILRSRGNEGVFTVTGVIKDIPENSSITFEYLLPFENSVMGARDIMRDNWYVAGSETFVMLNEHADAGKVSRNLEGYIEQVAPSPYLKSNTLHLLPLEEMYLSPELSRPPRKSSNPLYGWILASIALVVLSIAGINFMSLMLSRAARRGHEISIRKVVGAGKGSLRMQFLGEALFTCSLALVLGVLLAELAMPWFSSIIDKPVSLNFIMNPAIWGIIAGLLGLATLITGGYPAWILARQKITHGFISRTSSGEIPAVVKGMIVLQFGLAIAFLSSAIIMTYQMNYISSKDLGFNPDHLVDIEMSLTNPREGAKIYDTFSQQAKQLPGVQSVTPLYGMFGNSSMSTSLVTDSIRTSVSVEIIDEQFIETMQAEIVKGHDFSEDRTSEFKTGVLVNQEAAELLGWKKPVGKTIRQAKYKTFLDGKEVIGVVGNYHYRPLYYPVEPLFFVHRAVEGDGTFMMRARLTGGMMQETIGELNTRWNEINPAKPFKYSFVTDLIAEQYENQYRWEHIIQLASGFAILIACFGLFGLASLAARRRTKEISIRKVLGATISNIVALLNKDFLKLVVIGLVIAIPVAYYAMNQWLANFAYRIEIGPGIFLVAGGAAIAIALVTVSWQSIRAAMANPVDSLRSE